MGVTTLRFLFPVTVFFTGGIVLVIEIAATRILAPFFGNTIFSVSSILGVVLGALSIGYLVGGRLADRRPRADLFFLLIALAGFSLFFEVTLAVLFLPRFATSASLMWGPLVAALALFFIPNIFLGMLSPFAVRLVHEQKKSAAGVGTVAGAIFFFSTTGSIAGSFLTGFLLIPTFGVRTILFFAALSLVFLGTFGYVFIRRFKSASMVAFVGLTLGLFAGAAVFTNSNPTSGILLRRDGLYQEILIIEQDVDGRPARLLWLDRQLSGGIWLDAAGPSDLPLSFMRTTMVLIERLQLDIRRAFVIGGGSFTIPDALGKLYPTAAIDTAEIEPQLFSLAQKHFRYIPTAQTRHEVVDGRRFLARQNSRYDVIIVDAYQAFFTIPLHLMTREFFLLMGERLTDSGTVIMNVVGVPEPEPDPFLRAAMHTFHSVFPEAVFLLVPTDDPQPLRNVLFVASRKAPLLEISKGFQALLPPEDALLFTDNFAPVDQLLAESLARLREKN